MLGAMGPGGGHILIIDDDVEVTAMLGEYLRGEGFAVQAVYSAEDGVPAAVSGAYDAVILDVMLPRILGTEALRLIRQKSDVPVIMLTAKGDNVDRVVGLELGADDYVAKPYFPRELVARLRAVLRRRGARAPNAARILSLGDLQVDVDACKAACGERELELTASEFKLLAALLRASARVVSKNELSQQVLGRPLGPYDRSIDVHVSNLRQKLARSAGAVVLETVRGVGYRIAPAP